MPLRRSYLVFTMLGLLSAPDGFAQPAPAPERVVRINGTLREVAGQQPLVRFAIYDTDTGGTPLWQETQAVVVDRAGQYTAFLGATQPEGLPLDLFAGGAPRWLSVEGPAGAAGPRTLLAAVPYAVAAASASSLDGRPATDFQLTPEARRRDAAIAGAATGSATLDAPAATSGTANYVGKFVNSVDLGNSQLYDTGTRVGVGTTSPLDRLHVQFTNTTGALTGYAVQNLGSTSSSYSGMLFYDHTGTLRQFQGYNNGTGEYRINNLSTTGSINFLIGSTSAFLIDADGYVGIGQSAPSYKLDVQHGGGSGLRVQSTSSFSVVDIDATSGDAALRFAKAGDIQWNIRNNPATDDLQFFELGGGGERLRIENGTGRLVVSGDFTATGTKAFTIDHPLDPEHLLLRHAAAESNEVINFYSGNVTTDDQGTATVTLPAYFEAINRDYRYQLTVIGAFAQAIVSREVHDNQFEIATSQPHVKVSWEVKGVRNDAYMREHPFVETEPKRTSVRQQH